MDTIRASAPAPTSAPRTWVRVASRAVYGTDTTTSICSVAVRRQRLLGERQLDRERQPGGRCQRIGGEVLGLGRLDVLWLGERGLGAVDDVEHLDRDQQPVGGLLAAGWMIRASRCSGSSRNSPTPSPTG